MGVIQSAINSGMATLAAGIGAGKKIGTDVKKDKLGMESLKADKTKELADVQKQIPDVQENINKENSLVKLAKKGFDTEMLDDTDYDPAKKKYFAKTPVAPLDSKTKGYNVAKHKKALESYKLQLEGLKLKQDTLNKFLGIKEDKGGKNE